MALYGFQTEAKKVVFKAKIRIGTKQQFSFKTNRKQAQRTIYTQGVRGSSPARDAWPRENIHI